MLEEKIVDLTAAVERLVAILSEQGKIVPKPKSQADDAPTEDLKPMVLKMSRTGHKVAMRKKMDSYGAIKLDDLTAEQAMDFLAWLKTLEKK